MKSLKLFLASVAIFATGMLLPNTSEAQVTPLQVIGTFPKTDGGFEGQTAGTIWNKTGFKDTSISVWTVNTGPATIITTGGRSGPQYANLTYTGSGGHPIQSPTADSGAIRANTVYVVQYYYRTSTATGTNAVMTVCGAVNGTVDGFTSRPSPAIALAGTSGNWQKHTDTLGMYTALTPKCGYVGIRPSGAMGIALDIDDFVAYAGGIDSVAPNPSTSPTATPKSDGTKIRLSWTAPSTGVDSGGYMVVRGLADPSTAPNTNGIYAVGNTIATGQQVVYLGTGTSFVDTALTMGAKYYYRIYTVDKAFNYSSALSVNATTYTLGPNLLLNGTFGSATNWTGPLTVGAYTANSTYDFNYSAAFPTGGTAPCLRISNPSAAVNTAYYQAVTLTSGIYALDGLIKNSTSTSADYWVELYLTSKLPTNLGPDVVAIKDTTVEVAWLKQSGWGGVDNYDGKLSALASSMQDTIKTAGTYYFVIKAGTLGTGKLDAVIDNLTLNKLSGGAITIPAAPQNLVMADTSDRTITIKWRKNTEANFLRYRIYRGTSSAPTTKVDSTTGGVKTDTSKTFTGLTNGTRYYLRVTAVDSAGNESPYSNEVNGVPYMNYTLGPNLLTNGNFGSATGWTGPLTVGAYTANCVYDFNYSTTIPTGGTAPCLRISNPSAAVNSVYYQAVTLTSGKIYALDGLIKNSTSTSADYWVEFYLTSKLPTNLGPDVVANGDTSVCLAWLKQSGWGGVDNYDGKLSALASFRKDTIKTTGTYYFVIKTGTLGTGKLDAVLDNLTLNNLVFTGVKNEPASVVKSFGLEQNYPNPFNPGTSIMYQVSKEGLVSIKVYDLVGREVATLVNEVKPAGSYSTQWNAAGMCSGIYFYKMQANSFSLIRKMILLK